MADRVVARRPPGTWPTPACGGLVALGSMPPGRDHRAGWRILKTSHICVSPRRAEIGIVDGMLNAHPHQRLEVTAPEDEGATELQLAGTCRLTLHPILDARGLRIAVDGELDHFAARNLLAAVTRRARPRVVLHVDLRGVSFIDSAAHRALLELACHHDGDVQVTATSSAVDRVTALLTPSTAPSE